MTEGAEEEATNTQWDQHQQQVPFTASGAGHDCLSGMGTKLPSHIPPASLVVVPGHGFWPRHSTIPQFKIRKYLSGPDALYKHQMAMIKIKLN